jgi:hypothetical protein
VRLALEIVGGWLAFGGVVLVALIRLRGLSGLASATRSQAAGVSQAGLHRDWAEGRRRLP